MLSRCKLSLSFWWHAFSTAVHLINLLPTPVLKGLTPFQMLHHRPLDYTSLRVFGCPCYPFLRPYNNSKLQFRSSKCIFVGYSHSHKGYLCMHSSGRCYISETVQFNKSDFPSQSYFHQSLDSTSHSHYIQPQISQLLILTL